MGSPSSLFAQYATEQTPSRHRHSITHAVIVTVPPLEDIMSIGTIILIVLILMLVGVIPTWPHSRSWGYGPSGILGVIVVVLLILMLTGRL